MFNLKQDDIISKTDMLLFDILEELKQINKTQSLRPIAKDVVVEKKPKPKIIKPKAKQQRPKEKVGGAKWELQGSTTKTTTD